MQSLREHARATEDRHKIGVPTPPRHDVHVQVINDACPGAFAKVQSDVEPLRFCRGAQKRLRVHYQILKLDNFVLTKQ